MSGVWNRKEVMNNTQKDYWPWPKTDFEPEFEHPWGPETDEDLCTMFDRPVGERLKEAFTLIEGEPQDIC